jgi:hypothetical protein
MIYVRDQSDITKGGDGHGAGMVAALEVRRIVTVST